jgi:hypothetical protein
VPASALATDQDPMTGWVQLIRAEYQEVPGLCLTKSEVQRFWNLESAMRDAVLERLEAATVLRRTRHGAYVKA